MKGEDRLLVTIMGQKRPIQSLWLRDVCNCPRCVDPDSGQKNFSTTEIADELTLSYQVGENGDMTVVWQNDGPTGGGDHTSVYTAEYLQLFLSPGLRLSPLRNTLWDRSTYQQKFLDSGACRVSYKDWLHDEAAFWAGFEKLCETGLVFVTDVPEGSEHEVEKIANRIGILQHTFYGFTWDVRSKPQAENVAYTNVFLGLHQDLMYHDPIPRLQLLHCIENSCEGGESLFSDGFRAAYEMKVAHPDKYGTLTRTKPRFYYNKGGHHYEKTRNTIETARKEVVATRWAPPFQGRYGVARENPEAMAEWKRAATVFEKNISAEKNMLEVKLRPGECVIFDNWRILHGRREFKTATGSRWLKGTYVSEQVYKAMKLRLQERRGLTAEGPIRHAPKPAEYYANQARAFLKAGEEAKAGEETTE